MMIQAKLPEIERFTMRTANRSFQLEETVPGVFLLQGWFGGVLAAFVYVVAMTVWDESIKFDMALIIGAYLLIVTTIFGVIKATIVWAPYRLVKVQPRHTVRIIVASLATGLFAFATGYGFGTRRPNDMAAWMITLLLGGLPTAILIGSSVKPWELFTFGSIGGEKRRSVLGTLGTLPLRLMSLFCLALWILFYLSQHLKWTVGNVAILLVPIAYLSFSAYVTFSSPGKTVLLASGLIVNLVIACFSILAYMNHPYADAVPTSLRSLSEIWAVFLIAWGVFLVARLSARTHRTSMISAELVRAHNKRDHECLGSRFFEWDSFASKAGNHTWNRVSTGSGSDLVNHGNQNC